MVNMSLRFITAWFLFFFTALTLPAQSTAEISPDLRSALETITGPSILDHVKKLASDEFKGRAPGTRGEDLTVAYLVNQFKKVGALPGNRGLGSKMAPNSLGFPGSD